MAFDGRVRRAVQAPVMLDCLVILLFVKIPVGKPHRPHAPELCIRHIGKLGGMLKHVAVQYGRLCRDQIRRFFSARAPCPVPDSLPPPPWAAVFFSAMPSAMVVCRFFSFSLTPCAHGAGPDSFLQLLYLF